jgi:hypothetical protein
MRPTKDEPKNKTGRETTSIKGGSLPATSEEDDYRQNRVRR